MALKVKIFIILPIVLIMGAIYTFSNVDVAVTDEDSKVIQELKLKSECSDIQDFKNELQCIQAVQNVVYSHVDVGEGIGHNQSREPLQLISEGKGLCYDRSRFIEKILTYYNFGIRHVSIFYSDEASPLAILDKKAKSHAFLEVLTSKGWLLVDSIDPFIAIDDKEHLYTAATLRDLEDRIAFVDLFGNVLPQNFYKNYSVVYGLYSRHGKFYPPFTPIPDVNWKQFLKYNW